MDQETKAGPAEAAASYAQRLDKVDIAVRRMRLDEVDRTIAMMRAKIPAAKASDDTIHRVYRHNPDSFWGIYKRGDEEVPNAPLLGFFTLLFLTEEGARLMAEQRFNGVDPDLNLLTPAGGTPAAIYFWAIVAEGLTVPAGPMIFIALGERYAKAPTFVRATTAAGLRRVQRSADYRPVVSGRDGIGDLFVMERYPHLDLLKTVLPPAQPRRLNSRIEVRVAATPSEMEMALRIRAAFLIEQKCPYEEEYDGNDYAGTTFIAFFEGQPAGTLRVRYFADFVKLERLVVLPQFRGTTIAREIVKTAIMFCARKGYRKGYGQAQLHAVKFWQRFGFRPMANGRPLVFSDHDYIEFEGEFPAHDAPLTMKSDPYVLVRPEGHWDEPGILDRSATRPATNPH